MLAGSIRMLPAPRRAFLVMASRVIQTGRVRCRNQQQQLLVRNLSSFGEMAENLTEEEERKRRADEMREVFRNKKGRGWSDPWDITDLLESDLEYDTLPGWTPDFVSRISQEMVKIYQDPNESKIPTLKDLAALPLPPPPPIHPGINAKVYALHRQRSQYKHILERVTTMAQPKISAIQKLHDWDDKQEAVDVLFEEIEVELQKQEVVLGRHPKFGTWVERALEEYLTSIQKKEKPDAAGKIKKTSYLQGIKGTTAAADDLASKQDETSTTTSGEAAKKEADVAPLVSPKDDAAAVPVFMDCYSPPAPKKGDEKKEEGEEADVVPPILIPLKPKARGQSRGRMVEEWEISAHKKSKRIMLRQCTRKIAQVVSSDTPSRVFVHGKEGVGKSAALVAIVASARKSGSIVLYLPDGDQLHKNGFYIEPDEKREGIYNLPMLQQEVCKSMIDCHRNDLQAFQAEAATMEEFFTTEQLEEFKGYEKGGSISLPDLLSYGAQNIDHAPMCYSAAVDVLMKQDTVHFMMVMDEFNCFFEPGHYFYFDYDEDVKDPIPYSIISMFKPVLDAMAIQAHLDDDEDIVKVEPVLPKRGAVLVATTESHAVPRKFTDALVAYSQEDEGVHVVEVPRLSTLETEHMLANYEATGVGKLRLDRGETIMNKQEVAYLRIVSGGEPLKLMNACIME